MSRGFAARERLVARERLPARFVARSYAHFHGPRAGLSRDALRLHQAAIGLAGGGPSG